MEVNEVQGALGHPPSFSVRGMWALMRVGKINQKQEWKGPQENVHEDQREELLPAQPTGSGVSGFGGEIPPL